MYIYICIYIYEYTHTGICIFKYICSYIYLHTHTHKQTNIPRARIASLKIDRAATRRFRVSDSIASCTALAIVGISPLCSPHAKVSRTLNFVTSRLSRVLFKNSKKRRMKLHLEPIALPLNIITAQRSNLATQIRTTYKTNEHWDLHSHL